MDHLPTDSNNCSDGGLDEYHKLILSPFLAPFFNFVSAKVTCAAIHFLAIYGLSMFVLEHQNMDTFASAYGDITKRLKLLATVRPASLASAPLKYCE